MRLVKYTLLFVFISFMPWGAFAEERIPIAIMDFKVTNVSAGEVELLIDFLNNALFETGVFDVLQRDKRDKLLKEIKFSLSDVADARKTRQLGKLLSSKLVVFGSVGKLGANVIFNTSLVDVDTGRTISTYSKTYKSLDEIVGDLPKISLSVADAATQSMFLKKTNVIYYQDFQQQTWQVSDKSYYKNGQYHLYNKTGYWYLVENQFIDDFALECEMTFVEGDPNAGFGIIFRMQDEQNYYLFVITNNGQYTAAKYAGGKSTLLLPWTAHKSINPNATNTLKVLAVKNHFKFYINNVLLNQKDVLDPTFQTGKFGPLTLTNVHAAVSRMIAYQGNLVFYEYFGKPTENFIESEISYSKNGIYTVDAKDRKSNCYTWNILLYKNFSLKVEAMWKDGDPENGFGITFRLTNLENNYQFIITKSGFYIFGYYKDNEWVSLIELKKSRIINADGKNLLRVECIDDTFYLYINENLVETVTDSTFREGKIGFISQKGVRAAFDNVELFLLD